jgi:exopolyphosphatase/guanosine-5'-triphosphate,3'-diphosphate pyrophosphatase
LVLMAGGPHRVAIVDIGTNSTRLLVADVEDGRVEEVERRTRVTRLGRGVDLSGNLSSDGIEAVCEVLTEYVPAYRELGAESVDAIATSAVRDAANGEAFIAELRERFALGARVLGGEEEALLTYRGATAQRGRPDPVLVIDIGGGSTELIVGSGDEVAFHTSLQAGVVRQTERHLSGNPPTPSELEQLAGEILGLLSSTLSSEPRVYAEGGIAVAGTPTSLAAIEQELDPYEPRRVQGYRLSLGSVQRMLSLLASLPLAERREVTGLDPDRAPTIVAGAVILIEVMRTFGLDKVEVSEHDLLHGAAIEATRARNPQ